MVDGYGIFASLQSGGSNNSFLNNRIVQDGYLPDGVTQIGNGYDALVILAGGSNNHAHGNVVGYINSSFVRNDGNLAGCPEGNTGEWANNTHMPGPIPPPSSRTSGPSGSRSSLATASRWARSKEPSSMAEHVCAPQRQVSGSPTLVTRVSRSRALRARALTSVTERSAAVHGRRWRSVQGRLG